MTYGKRLDAALTHAKKSRKELAAHIGQSPQSVGMVITGKNERLSTEASAKAAAFLRVDHNWLVTGKGAMVPAQPTAVAVSESSFEPPLSHDAIRLGRWLDKIKDPDVHWRTANAAMAVVTRVVDGPPIDTNPTQPETTRKRRGERSGR